MREWLRAALKPKGPLPEAAEGYLLGRGMRERTIHRLGITLWTPPQTPAPDEAFRERYGENGRGEYLAGRLVCPALSPRGDLLGFEARSWQGEKRITDYRLPEASWNPFFLGLTPEAMRKLWDGGDVWIVEGLFDLAPMERVVPGKDVVLATVRAKLSDAHIAFLKRILKPSAMVHMVYDNDETGRKQIDGWVDEKTGKRRWGALQRLGHVGVGCRDIPYRGGKDPGEIWDTGGEEALRRAFSHVI